MSDTVFYLLDALLGAARGMLLNNKAKQIKEEYGLDRDPRGTISRLASTPMGGAAFNVISGYFLNKDMTSHARDVVEAKRYFS